MTHTGQDPSHFFVVVKKRHPNPSQNSSKFNHHHCILPHLPRWRHSKCLQCAWVSCSWPTWRIWASGRKRQDNRNHPQNHHQRRGKKWGGNGLNSHNNKTTYPSPRNFMNHVLNPPKSHPGRWWMVFRSFLWLAPWTKLTNRLTTVAPALAKKPGKTRWPGLLVSEQL